MATRHGLPSGGTVVGAAPGPSASWAYTGGTSRVPLPVGKSNTPFDSSGTYTKTGTAAGNVLGRQFVGDPLAAQTITGTASLVIACLESTTSADMSLQMILRVVSNDGSVVRGTLYGGHAASNNANSGALGQEMATSGATRIMGPVTLTSVTAQLGDRLVAEVGARSTATTSGHSCIFQWGDPSAAADYAFSAGNASLTPAAWLELSQTLAFATAADLTKFFLGAA